MAWVELQIPSVDETGIEALSQRLFSLGAAGVQEDWMPGETPSPQQPWDDAPHPIETNVRLIRAWFEDPDPPRIAQALAPSLNPATFSWETVPETDWETSWREGFEPIRISESLVITTPWEPINGALVIEPGQAFGTGAHPSTLAILRWIDTLDLRGTFLDVGCGSGILALAATKLGCTGSGIDTDADSVQEAQRNAEINHLTVAFSTKPIHQCEPADTVLCNLYAEAIVGMMDDLIRCTGERLILAGLLTERVSLVEAALAYRLDIEHRDVQDAWTCLVLKRRS